MVNITEEEATIVLSLLIESLLIRRKFIKESGVVKPENSLVDSDELPLATKLRQQIPSRFGAAIAFDHFDFKPLD